MAQEPEKNIPCKKISHWNEAENDNLFVPNNCSTAESLKLSRVRNTGNGYDILILIYWYWYIDLGILMLIYRLWNIDIDVDILSLVYRYRYWYIDVWYGGSPQRWQRLWSSPHIFWYIDIDILRLVYRYWYIDIWYGGPPQRWQRLWSSPHRRRCPSWSTSKPTRPSSSLPEPEVKNI